MTARTLAVVSAGMSTPSSTGVLADRLAQAARSALAADGVDVEVVRIDLRELAHALTDNLLLGYAGEALQAAQDRVVAADGLIAVTPVYSGSYTGLFKTFFDVLDPEALADTPVLVGATAGTARHSLVLDHALRPLFSYLRAVVVPTGVFAASEDWGGGDGEQRLAARIERAAGQLAQLVAGRPQKVVVDPFEAAVPFDQLLDRGSR